ncbi:MAG: hypothetical protein JWN01_734 [Patescibacteria group bacterium]|nr:hypothetical protein [Patescibacteria group bacterium]
MYKSFTISLTIIVLVVGAVFLLAPNTVENGFYLRNQMVMSAALFVTQVCAAWYFLTSLRTFRTQFKIAYGFLSAGIILLGVAQLQLPLLVFFHITDTKWVSWGFILLPYIFSAGASYLGMRRFARILSVKSPAGSRWLVFGLAAMTAVLATQLPHLRVTDTPAAEAQLHIYVALVAWNLVLTSASLMLVLRIIRALGPFYAGAIKWLAAASAIGVVGWGIEWVMSSSLPINNWYAQHALGVTPGLIAGLVLLAAGTAFKALSHQRLASDASYIDVVIKTAQLVSNPHDIQPAINKVRAVTAHLGPAQEPNAHDNNELIQAYREIEDYIITKEVLRKFSRAELRARLPEAFESALVNPRTIPA